MTSCQNQLVKIPENHPTFCYNNAFIKHPVLLPRTTLKFCYSSGVVAERNLIHLKEFRCLAHDQKLADAFVQTTSTINVLKHWTGAFNFKSCYFCLVPTVRMQTFSIYICSREWFLSLVFNTQLLNEIYCEVLVLESRLHWQYYVLID